MNAKKLLRTLLVVICISMSVPAISDPLTETVPGEPAQQEKTVKLMARLQEIKDMNKENLSRTEKRELRKEVKQMHQAVKTSKNGVYLSIGAIIIIVLLLILLL